MLLNDVASPEETKSPYRSPTRSPHRSPKSRGVSRTHSNPCPSPSIHAVVGANSLHSFGGDSHSVSPMSYASSPSFHHENVLKARKPSPDKQALLSSSADYDSDESDEGYSPHSKKRSFLPKRGLDRTPSALLAGVRNHLKENRGEMLSKMKKTFSISGRGKDTFAEYDDHSITIGLTPEKGYVGVKERRRKMAESAGRRGQVKNSLYACMSDSDSSVEISVHDDDSAAGHGKGSASVASYNPNKTKKPNHHQSPKASGPPRRVNSLPIGIRRTPN